jgi:hypothetical protein
MLLKRVGVVDRDCTEKEIEITPEMIEAGAEAVLEIAGGVEDSFIYQTRELAKRVYLAMDRLKPKRS